MQKWKLVFTKNLFPIKHWKDITKNKLFKWENRAC